MKVTAGLGRLRAIAGRKPKQGCVQHTQPKSKSAGHRILGLFAFGLVITLVVGLVLPIATAPVAANPAMSVRTPSFYGAGFTADKGMVVSKPSGTAEGDFLIMALYGYKRGNAFDLTGIPEGWQLLDSYSYANLFSWCYYKVATASEPSSYTFTLTQVSGGSTNYANMILECVVGGGYDTNDPIDTYSTTAYVVNDATVRASMTTTADNEQMIFFAGIGNFGGTFTEPSVPENWTEDKDYNYANYVCVEACHLEWTSHGATGNIDATASGAATQKHAYAVALNLPPPAPEVATYNATDVDYFTATLNGGITDVFGSNCTVRGFQYDTDSGAPYTYDWHEDGNFGTGNFTGELTSLSENQDYYFRVYATNPAGTTYGDELGFTTLDAIAPSVTTLNATDIGYITATLHGNVTDIGTHNVTTRGFEWDTDSGAPYANNWTEDGNFTAGEFTHNLTGLSDGQTYYFRVLAINPGDITYGSELSFNTTAYTAPVVTSSTAANITLHTAIAFGDITDVGGQNVTTRGFDWGYASGNYTVTWNETGNWTTGAFDYTLTGLTSGATVYWQAWAVNPVGRGNSTELSFVVGELPRAPANFTIEHGLVDIFVITWDAGYKADTTIVVGSEDHYPTSPTDGYVIYTGNATDTTLQGVNADIQTCFIRAWSYNSYGYSVDYAEDMIGDSFGIIPIVFCVTMAGFALWKKGWIRVVLSISLIIFGATAMSYDIKFAAPFLTVGVVLFIMATMRQIQVARGGE